MAALRNTLLLLGLSVITPSGLAATFKCVGADGAVSYQDHPCPGDAQSETVSPGAPGGDGLDFEPLFVPIPGNKQVALAVFHTMTSAVHRGDPRATTVRLNSKPGQPPVAILLTFFDNPDGRTFSDEEVSDIVLGMAEPHVADSMEGYARLWEARTELGTAVFSTLNNRQYFNKTPPRGEYRTITVGQIPTSHTLLAFTILTNGMDSDEFRDAMAVLQSAQIILDKPAAPAAASTSRPAAPAGYEWQECPEIKGALLRPDGWFFKKETGRDSIAYFVSKENIDAAGEFTTGLTMNVLQNVDTIMGSPPSIYAEELIAEAARSSDVRNAPWTHRMGPFLSHGVVITTPDLVKGDFVTHMLAIANDRTGTMYLVTFESPVETWQSASQIADPMLKKLWIDSDI